MRFLYGLVLQWKLDIRSKNLLITCYIVPVSYTHLDVYKRQDFLHTDGR